MSLISIVIPVYNASQHLKKCIDSLIIQSYQNIEIICIDNNSKDNSLNLLHNFAKLDNRIKIYSNTIPGASATRNLGIQKAKGGYIVFVDSDDWVGVDYIKNLYEGIIKNNSDMCCSVINQQDKKGNIWNNDWYKYTYMNIEYNKNYNKNYLLLNIACFPFESFSKIFKTDVLKNNNILYKTNLIIAEDVDFILQYVNSIDNFTFSIINKDDYFYFYSITTTSYNPQKFLSIFNFLNELEKEYPGNQEYKKILINFKVNKIFYYTMPIWEVVAPYSYFKQLKNHIPKKADYKYLTGESIAKLKKLNKYAKQPLRYYLKLSLYIRFNIKEDIYIIKYFPKALILSFTKLILNIYAKIMKV